jgi:hypothetical protein
MKVSSHILQIPLYRTFFLVNLLVVAAWSCAGNFITLFASDTLKLDMGGTGHIFVWTAPVKSHLKNDLSLHA